MSDQERISPCNINTILNRQETRIEKKISIQGIISWSDTKFSELKLYEFYGGQ